MAASTSCCVALTNVCVELLHYSFITRAVSSGYVRAIEHSCTSIVVKEGTDCGFPVTLVFLDDFLGHCAEL